MRTHVLYLSWKTEENTSTGSRTSFNTTTKTWSTWSRICQTHKIGIYMIIIVTGIHPICIWCWHRSCSTMCRWLRCTWQWTIFICHCCITWMTRLTMMTMLTFVNRVKLMGTDGSYKWRERERRKSGILHINIIPRIIHSLMKRIKKRIR